MLQTGAAVLGVPVKPTIKEVDSSGMVVKTLVRAHLWEVQTPQVCSKYCAALCVSWCAALICQISAHNLSTAFSQVFAKP